MGMAALAFDGGQVMLERRDQQNAADAAAIAAARYVRSDTTAATNAAVAVATANGVFKKWAFTKVKFDPDNPADIASAIRRFVLLTSEQKHTMARKARAFAEQELAVGAFVDAYEQLFVRMQ